MKQRILKIAAALALLLGPGRAARALETGFEFRASNLQFPWDAEEPLAASVTAFPATNYFWGGEAWLAESLGEDAAFRISYERDPVLRNSVTASVEFERGIARIAVGPRIGLFNSAAAPYSAGLYSAVRLQWPGVAYLSMRSDGGLAVGVLASGADPQARTVLAAGLYVPNAILSAVIAAKRFNEFDSGGDTLVTDSWTRYALEIDIYKKNVPYTFLGSLGYEQRSKRFLAADAIDTLGAVVLGAKATMRASRALSLSASLDSSFYVFGLDELQNRGPASDSFLFSAGFGMAFDIDALREEAKAARAARELAEAETEAAAAEAAQAAEAEAKAAAEAAPPENPAPAWPPAEAPASLIERTPAAAEPPVEPSAEEPPADIAAQAAEKPASSWSLESGAGLCYNFAALPAGPFAILAALFNVRGGAWAGLDLDLGRGLSVGGEAGLQYINASLDGGTTSINIFDLPLRATASYGLGKLGVKAFAGLLATGAVGSASPLELGFGLEGGARLKLGSFYLEGSYVLGLGGAASYPRAGTGFALDLSKAVPKP